MDFPEFKRIYPLRAPNIMWFLGAGASAAANIPTAYDMIWEFKRSIFATETRMATARLADLNDPKIRFRIQSHFAQKEGAPAEDSIDEYSYYFEFAYSSEQDRRNYIAQMLSGASPCYGQIVLASLLKVRKANIIWTTNFDRLLEDSLAQIQGAISSLTVSSIDTSDAALQCMNEQRFPLLVKLHGDYQYRKLKNTLDELRSQEAKLRHALIEACKRYGLAIAGYSGRDESIIAALDEALNNGHGFPSGLFWFVKDADNVLPQVQNLISKAKTMGVDAHIIQVETFNELMGDLVQAIPNMPPDILSVLSQSARIVSNVSLPPTDGTWPLIATNAFYISQFPSVCRRIVCTVGGTKEVREVIQASGKNILAARREVGIIGFGSDSDIRTTFAPHNITQFDVHSIEPKRLRYESQELGLMYDSITSALVRNRPLLRVTSRSGTKIAIDPKQSNDEAFSPLKKLVRIVTGKTADGFVWSEAIRVRLDYKLEKLWLLIEPTIWVDKPSGPLPDSTKEFIRSKLASRYNQQSLELIKLWANILLQGNEAEVSVQALGVSTGLDAEFKILRQPAFSLRQKK